MAAIRIGYGIDFHQLGENRKLMIGGVDVPYEKGSVGHSDADVLLHAICDALLGALALGDIGTHFPDTEPSYKNIDSQVLLKKSYQLVKEKGYQLVNMDCSVCLQQPKLKPFIPEMRETIAQCMGVETSVISIKATTTEKMGYVGNGEGIEAHASVLLEEKHK
ncbi:MAG TPA: 2-C-methyl-D-erythritol 2,4-cyclodiphosphate synthase [Chitinophagaceae bacterium]|nr:2-C-methyl-D-erythritol 2,4-cyclodiphosphate synthase [Chitinophagaceae bacterium]